MPKSKIHTQSYASANEELGNRDFCNIANNTYLVRRDEGCIAIKLHNTDVVTYYASGYMVVCTGGWRTNTTRDRINGSTDIIRISSLKGEWTIRDGDKREYYYQEKEITLPDGTQTYGVAVSPSGEVLGCTLILASLISATTGVECTNESCTAVIAGLAFKELKKLWRRAKEYRATVIEHCSFTFLPLFLGECKGRGEWEQVYKDRLARGC